MGLSYEPNYPNNNRTPAGQVQNTKAVSRLHQNNVYGEKSTKFQNTIVWKQGLVSAFISVSDLSGESRQIFGPSGILLKYKIKKTAFCCSLLLLSEKANGIATNLVVPFISSTEIPVDWRVIACNKYESIDLISKFFQFIHPYFPFRNPTFILY